MHDAVLSYWLPKQVRLHYLFSAIIESKPEETGLKGELVELLGGAVHHHLRTMTAAIPRSILVLYGSETGNAQDMAEELGKMLQRLQFKATVQEMDSVRLQSLLEHRFVVFVISTTGQGDMPRNSAVFWRKLLQKKLLAGCLAQLKYTYFGLGDSTYLKFNWAARKLVRRLGQLGASTFFDGFEADEQFPDGIDGSFARWSQALCKYLLEKCPPPADLGLIPDDQLLPARWSLEPALRDAIAAKINLRENEENGENRSKHFQLSTPPISLLPVPDSWAATLSLNKRVTPDSHWQDVRHLSFDIPPRTNLATLSSEALQEEVLGCRPGDCLTIYPRNSPEDAQRLITLMAWDDLADLPLDLSKCGNLPRNLFSPTMTTIRNLLLNNIDITAIPRRSFLKSLSFFSTDADHTARLLEFNMPEYIDEYFDYATRSRRTIIEVLEEFTSVQLPAERLLDIFPIIRGRDFSIANGGDKLYVDAAPTSSEITAVPANSVTRVDLLVALVRYQTILRKPRQGLCSRYLADLPLSTRLTVTRKRVLSPIDGNHNAKRPLIAIATGTGIAPVRSLVHERLTHSIVGRTMIFFGNRNCASDYFFKDEWLSLCDEGKKSNLTIHTAFSRDQKEKIYVQDVLRREASALAELMRKRPIFVVCGGSSKMANACKNAVFDPFVEAAGDDDGEKERRRELLKSGITWWQEIW